MIIDKNSWHYRLIIFSNGHAPRSLCPYFWKVVLLLAVFGVLTFFGTMTLLAMLLAPYAIVTGYVDPDGAVTFFSGMVEAGKIMWTVALIFASVFGIFYCIHELKERIRDKKTNTPSKPPNIAVEFIKAKKAKICPTISFR